MSFLHDQPVLLLGLGDSGLAMARWCVRHGARLSWWDSREQTTNAAALAAEWPATQRLVNLPDEAATAGFRLILKSPGLSPQHPAVAPLLQQARAAAVRVMGELDLFVQALAELKSTRGYGPKVLAITGTNGKTTVTAMTALLVERAGHQVAMAGNIGPTMLDTLQAALDLVDSHAAAAAQELAAAAEIEVQPALATADAADEAEAVAQAVALASSPADEAPSAPRLPDVWVLELSSFQLAGGGEGVVGFEPDAATVLNLSQDHLDWHGDMAAYGAAKSLVYGSADGPEDRRPCVAVLNLDDEAAKALLIEPAADVKSKPKGKPAAKLPPPRERLHFGTGAPQTPGDFGLVHEGGMAWLVRALPLDPSIKIKKGQPAEDLHIQRLMPADALRVRGRHNAANALAALALATAIDCPLAPMLHGLREYRGQPHRLAFVADVDGVMAYDDSKATNVGATVAALAGLGADLAPARLLLILGGDGKGQDFRPLAAPLARHARAVALIGRDAAAIEAALAGEGGAPTLQHCDTLEAAVAWCFGQAQRGDAVLLSPACASLDMFRNYAHRAEVFVAAVQSLAAERGQA